MEGRGCVCCSGTVQRSRAAVAVRLLRAAEMGKALGREPHAPVPVPLVHVLVLLVQLGSDAVYRLQHRAARPQPHGAAHVRGGTCRRRRRQAVSPGRWAWGGGQVGSTLPPGCLPESAPRRALRAARRLAWLTLWHEDDHRVRRGGVKLGAVGISPAQHVACKLDHRNLQPQGQDISSPGHPSGRPLLAGGRPPPSGIVHASVVCAQRSTAQHVPVGPGRCPGTAYHSAGRSWQPPPCPPRRASQTHRAPARRLRCAAGSMHLHSSSRNSAPSAPGT